MGLYIHIICKTKTNFQIKDSFLNLFIYLISNHLKSKNNLYITTILLKSKKVYFLGYKGLLPIYICIFDATAYALANESFTSEFKVKCFSHIYSLIGIFYSFSDNHIMTLSKGEKSSNFNEYKRKLEDFLLNLDIKNFPEPFSSEIKEKFSKTILLILFVKLSYQDFSKEEFKVI